MLGEFICFDITNVMLTKLNCQNLIIKDKKCWTQEIAAKKEKGGVVPNSKENTRWLSKQLKYHKKMYIYNTTFNLIKLN